MGFIDRAVERRSRVAAMGTLLNPQAGLASLFGSYGPTVSGIEVNEFTARNLSAVWGCILGISDDLAKLPRYVYQKSADGDTIVEDHWLWWLFNVAPNDEMTAFDFWTMLAAHALSWGNGRAEIERNNAGRPIALWPMLPERTNTRRLHWTWGPIVHDYTRLDGTFVTLKDADVFHLKSLSHDGVVGISPIRQARESIGMGLAAQAFGASFFGNGAMPKIVLRHPQKLTGKGPENLRESWENIHKGPEKSNRPAILEEGVDIKVLSLPPDDSQFLETRQFAVVDAARWYRYPPHKLGDWTGAKFANIEQSNIMYVSDCLDPWGLKIQQEARRKLLSPVRDRGFTVRTDFDVLRRGDMASRFAAYAIGRQWGIYNVDEIRNKEGENPLPNGQGQTYLSPINMEGAQTAAAKDGTVPDTSISGNDPAARQAKPKPAADQNGGGQ